MKKAGGRINLTKIHHTGDKVLADY